MSNLMNVRPKEVAIECDGKTYPIVFDLNAIAELEDHYGSVEAAFEAVDSGSVKAIRKILWVGLLHHNDDITEREVGRMITMTNLPDIMAQVVSAMNNGLPTVDDNTNIPN